MATAATVHQDKVACPCARSFSWRPSIYQQFKGSCRGVRPGGRHIQESLRMPRRSAGATTATLELSTQIPLNLEDNNLKNLPMNTFTEKMPCRGKVLSIETIVGPNAPGECCNIVIDHQGQMPFVEGQSLGVIPPGENRLKPGKPNHVRLYSIASSRYGDHYDGKTATLLVRRVEYVDPATGQKDPFKKGVCSNFLCDIRPGDEVVLTGPTGKMMIMTEDPKVNIIMVATGSGIAPFRGFIRRAFMDRPPNFQYSGFMWLFHGVANMDALLYDADWKETARKFPNNFRYDIALSRDETSPSGAPYFVQDKIAEHKDKVLTMLQQGAQIYFCGLKGMMPGFAQVMTAAAKEKGQDWEVIKEELKRNGQWHVEVC